MSTCEGGSSTEDNINYMSVFDNEPFSTTEENETSNCKRKRTVPSVDEKHESQPNSKKTCYDPSLESFVRSIKNIHQCDYFKSELEKILSRAEKTMESTRKYYQTL